MITEHIEELREIKRFYEFRHRQKLGLKPTNFAPQFKPGRLMHKMHTGIYRQSLKAWRAGLRKLNRQIAGIDYAITIIERTEQARELLRSKANARAVDSVSLQDLGDEVVQRHVTILRRKKGVDYCAGCGEPSPCKSDCPTGTYRYK